MKSDVVLHKRDAFGKVSAAHLRKQGLTLGIINSGSSVTHIALDAKFVAKGASSPYFLNTVINAELDGKSVSLLPKELSFHPVDGTVLHIDFAKVEKNTPVSVLVPVAIEGSQRCVGLKLGGKLNMVKYNVSVVCKPDAIPEKIAVDISAFNIGKTLNLSDVAMPAGVSLKKDCVILSIIGRNRRDADEAAAQVAESQTK